MSPTSEGEDPVDVKDSGSKPEESAAADATGKQAAKRRTKTGCLSECAQFFSSKTLHFGVYCTDRAPACRKRRIKCGEEKPVSILSIWLTFVVYSNLSTGMPKLHQIK